MITIRNIDRAEAANHAEELAALWVTTFKEAYAEDHSPENIEAYCQANFSIEQAGEWLAKPGIRTAIAERDGVPVGFYMVRYIDCPMMLPGPSTELKQIYVLKSEFGRGTGQKMFEHARQRILGTGRSWMWLFVADQNERAKAFYEKLNFGRVGPGPVFNVGTDRLPSSLLARCL